MNAGVVVPLHLGALHPFETVLLFLIAFGPFVVLTVVVARQRRRDDPELSPGRARPSRRAARPRAPH